MANEIKRIFKNEIIGQPQFQKVLRNKIKGVSGTMMSSITSAEKDLTQLQVTPIVNAQKVINSIGNGIQRVDNNYVLDISVNVDFNVPTKIDKLRIDIEWVAIEFYFSKVGIYLTEAEITLRTIGLDRRNMTKLYGWHTETPATVNYTDILTKTIDNPNPNPTHSFNYSANFKLNADDESLPEYEQRYKAIASTSYVAANDRTIIYSASSFYPNITTVTLIGTDITQNEVVFQVGEQTNAFPFPKNSLITTAATFNGVPLYQYRANEIINEWSNGKQITNATKLINDNPDLETKGDDVILINARETDFVDDSQSFSRYADGTARVFEIDSAEVAYDGSLRQNLNISENRSEL